MNKFYNYLARVQRLFKPKFKYSRVEDLPDKIQDNHIYILGEGQYEWSLALLCPCGCGELIQLNIRADEHPFWQYNVKRNRITVEPSIWRKMGCRSHFRMIKSHVYWCKNLFEENHHV